jgi:hypothetical protein
LPVPRPHGQSPLGLQIGIEAQCGDLAILLWCRHDRLQLLYVPTTDGSHVAFLSRGEKGLFFVENYIRKAAFLGVSFFFFEKKGKCRVVRVARLGASLGQLSRQMMMTLKR